MFCWRTRVVRTSNDCPKNAQKKATSADIDELFDGYDAAVDFPACSFVKEFMEKYPDAKVIFSQRDPEAWRKSVLDTIYGFRANRDSWIMRYVVVSDF